MRSVIAVLVATAAGLLTGFAPADDSIRVLVYNIHAGKDAGGIDNLARVAAVVRDARADLVLLQEVDRGTRRSGGVDQVAVLEQATGMHGAFGNTLDYDGGQYGIALLSRWPIVSDTLVRLRVTPPQERAGGSYEPRGALRARVESPVGTLTIVTTHLDPSGNDHWRLQEVRGVLDVASGAGERSMVLVGGDFNSTPESATQQTIRQRGLRDAFSECGTGAGLTYPADSGTKRIDYLFLTGDARCASATVLPTTASDHRPLLVEVLLPRPN